MVSDFRKKQKYNLSKKLWFAVIGLVILFLSVVLIIANVKVGQKKKALDMQVENLQKKIEEIKSKNNELELGILKSNDEEYIEKIAREELDLQKPGEKVFSFVTKPGEEEKKTKKPNNFFQAWLGWIGGIFKK